MSMAFSTFTEQLLLLDGIFPVRTDDSSSVFFLDPCLLMSASYSHHLLLPTSYYSRSFFLLPSSKLGSRSGDMKEKEKEKEKKRIRKRKKTQTSPNSKELLALKRHQEIRKLIFDAHNAFLESPGVTNLLRNIESRIFRSTTNEVAHHLDQNTKENSEIKGTDLVELGTVWQASLCEMTFSKVGGSEAHDDLPAFPLFNYMVENNDDEELVGTSFDTSFVIPKKSRFFMSDIADIQELIPCQKENGYNLILIDPPWENKSVHRHGLYPTLPDKYLLSLPLKELAHSDGAVVGLWVTNREKLRTFVDNELFPTWGMVNCTTWYWLKIKSSGEMISELDLPRQKPYECLLLGFISPQVAAADSQSHFSKVLPENYVFISIPGHHSRKPPLPLLLSKFMPKQAPVRGLELFARDMNPEWTSWGNEPLHFQQAHYFGKKVQDGT